ncbi:hypothetical protein AGABI2DRAFT_114851 [Agaricus bisporus var. bisporus H97]|uniref:hypothetical protein n=1 Tax=Agaricus bisporus var. bisporus (strain H97 / ATCC MYA-4626 / FGSC 10389) TaxID=936046 RepID=UPI00029F75E4|nr:hypothetical protein AGABI2DRAFT_114851 [Agaricus bisporus var. bisporus H97]EKV49772.1 hypothetical protein AGABI2DRAFT_114851 [Agaricus bisporus var. bisporus H97]
MFFRVLVATLVALPALVSAIPAPGRYQTTSAVSRCNIGEPHCCNQVQAVPEIMNIPINLLGFGCTPLSDFAISGNNCNAQAVCCDNFNEITRHLSSQLACSPVNVDPYEG